LRLFFTKSRAPYVAFDVASLSRVGVQDSNS
jgi:hypothetical protein